MILGRNYFFVRESQTIFCSFHKVLENHDLGKRHKIWTKLHCPPNFFGLVRLPANNRMQGPQGPCTGNCAGPVRAARTGPVSIWPRVPKWPHMGLTARVSWRRNADFLHDVFWRYNADFLHGFTVVNCRFSAPFL